MGKSKTIVIDGKIVCYYETEDKRLFLHPIFPPNLQNRLKPVFENAICKIVAIQENKDFNFLGYLNKPEI